MKGFIVFTKDSVSGWQCIPVILLLLTACTPSPIKEVGSVANWQQIETRASGEDLTLMMWQGDPLINAYMRNYVVPQVKERYNIELQIVGGQGNEIVALLMTELEASKPVSTIDMTWINGETFYQLRQINGLYGPFTEYLPNNHYINWENPFIAYDFQQPVEGFECPWGNVQFVLIYNGQKIAHPPDTPEELAAWVKKNPGKFTISNDFTGMTLLKSLLIYFAGGKGALKGSFDEVIYAKASAKLWDYLNGIKPYFWNRGETFPASIAQMHQLFAQGEIWFTMSNNDTEVDNKIEVGLFHADTRAYVWNSGTVQNSHYMGIVRNSAHKQAAMVICNFLISPEAQLEKMRPSVWGDGTVLDSARLPLEWKEKFKDMPERKRAPTKAALQAKALMEPAPEYMIRIFEDFRRYVLEQ